MGGMSVADMRQMSSLRRDRSVVDKQLRPGTWRRVFGFAQPYRIDLTVFIVLVVLDAVIGVLTPVLAGLLRIGGCLVYGRDRLLHRGVCRRRVQRVPVCLGRRGMSCLWQRVLYRHVRRGYVCADRRRERRVHDCRQYVQRQR